MGIMTDFKKLRDADRALTAASERAEDARRSLIQTIHELRESGATWSDISNHTSVSTSEDPKVKMAGTKMWFRRNTRPGDLPEPATTGDADKEPLHPPTTEGMSAAEMAAELGLGEGAFRYQFAKEDSPLHDRVDSIPSSYKGVNTMRYKFKS